MSKKLDGVYSMFYQPHLAGGQPRYREMPASDFKLNVYNMFWRVLTELSFNRFKWKHLPASVDERFLELTLLRHGGALFFQYHDPEPDPVTGPRFEPRFLVQPFTSVGPPNHYDNPTAFRVQSHTLIGGTYTPRQAVPIWGNYLRTPDMDIISVYTHRLTELDVTIDVNTRNMRHPKVLVTDQDSRLSIVNFDRQVDEGVPTIKVAPHMSPQEFIATTLDMSTHHETIPGLLASKGKVWNDALMMMGVPTVNQDKKERLITGEAETGKDQAEVIRNIALNSRKQSCEQINELFGLNIEVEWRSEEEQLHLVSAYTDALGINGVSGEPVDDVTTGVERG